MEIITVRVKIITGSLVTPENLFSQNYRYRYRLEIRMNSFNYHYRYRLGVRSHIFISIDSQLPSWKSFELISPVFQVRKNSLNIKFLGRIFLGHPGPRRRDIPDKNFMQVAFFCCFRQCPGIWVGTSRIWKNFMQENFGLIFRTLVLPLPLPSWNVLALER